MFMNDNLFDNLLEKIVITIKMEITSYIVQKSCTS